MKHSMINSLVGGLLLAGLVGGSVHAAVPRQLNFQGRLTDNVGVALNGPHEVVFRLYDVDIGDNGLACGTVGANCLWVEALPAVSVNDGLLSVVLGSDVGNPLPPAFDQPLFITIAVDADPEMNPRLPLVSNPYALNADLLDGKDAASFLDTSATPQTKIGDLSVADLTVSGNDIRFGAGPLIRSPSANTITIEDTAGTEHIRFTTAGLTQLSVSGGTQLNGTLAVLGTVALAGPVLQISTGGPAAGFVLTSSNAIGSATWQDPGPLVGSVAGRPLHNIAALDTVGGVVGEHTSIAIGVDGLPIISYRADTDLKVAHCLDVRCTSATTTQVATGGVGGHTSITIGQDGFPVISYIGPTNQGLWVAHCQDTACTASTIIEVALAEAESTSIAIGVDGFPVISYSDGQVTVAHCLDVSCTSSLTSSIGIGGPHSSLAIGNDGFPIISAFDNITQTLAVAHCGDISCFSPGLITINTFDSFAGLYTSIAIAADGFPIISYVRLTSLKVAHCKDLTCSAPVTTQTLDTLLVQPTDTSITIRPDGIPVISYFDPGDPPIGSLKIARCKNQDCSGSIPVSTTFVLDIGGEGEHSSITIGMDGFPVISYFDATNRDLKVVHCSNPSCVPWYRPR